MELYTLKVFQTVVTERSFSRAAQRLERSQPAVTQAIQKLEREIGAKLFDRGARELSLTDCGRVVLDYCRRFDNLEEELDNSITEVKDVSAGRLIIGASETTWRVLVPHLRAYRKHYPKIAIQVRRTSSSRIPGQLADGDLELGVLAYKPDDSRLESHVIGADHLALVVARRHRFARRASVKLEDLAGEVLIGHAAVSPYREAVARAFQRAQIPLHLPVEMPTAEAVRALVTLNEGIAFLPSLCVSQELADGTLREVKVEGVEMSREVYLVLPTLRVLSHAAKAFFYVATGPQLPDE